MTIISTSIVSHVGMRFAGWVIACALGGHVMYRKSASGCERVHLIDPQKYQRKIHRRFQSCADVWRDKTNHWRVITSLNPMVRVTHQRRRGMMLHLAFARLVGRFLLYGDLGVISALNQHQRAAPTMDRDDALFWLSLFWFVALCGLAIWMLLSA
jgi:hypothetical protein